MNLESLSDEQLADISNVFLDVNSGAFQKLANHKPIWLGTAIGVYDVFSTLENRIDAEQYRRAKGVTPHAITLTVADVESIIGWLSVCDGEGMGRKSDYELGVRLLEQCPEADQDYKEECVRQVIATDETRDKEFEKELELAYEVLTRKERHD